MKIKTFISACILTCAITAEAKITLPPVISDDMVLQRETEVKLWGKSDPSSTVKITPSWSGKTFTTKSDTEGNWSALIKTGKAGGPYNITISDGDKTVLNNILLGEVWLCSGQSNMEMPLKGFTGQPVENALDAIIESLEYPQIRVFTFKRTSSHVPQDKINGSWAVPSLENTPSFSATAYFFARTLHKVLGIPVGIIHSSWGGSNIEAWIGKDYISKYPQYKPEEIKADAKAPNRKPTMMFNAMIYPLRHLTVKGFTWYQGESNINNCEQYHDLFTDMVSEWRSLFPDAKEKPFYFVQIAPYKYPAEREEQSPYMREAQASCLDIPNTGMVVTLDIGLDYGIHPEKKEEVGKRLAYQALAKTYNMSIPCDGPVLKNVVKSGNKLILEFDHADGGLSPLNKPLESFEIAGKDGKFVPANAIIRLNKVNVWSDTIKEPEYVRYGFSDYPKASLFNCFGLPAGSFRTDKFERK